MWKILLASFETSQMVSKYNRKIRNRSVRNLLTFAHYRFATFLKHKAFEYGKKVKEVSEEYTSKINPLTGETGNVGSAKHLKIGKEIWINRDLCASFNIMLKTLGDFPNEFKLIAVNKS